MKKKIPKKKKIDTLEFFSEIQDKSDAKIKGYIDIQRAKTDEDMKRYIGAVSEDFQSKVAVVAEQYVDISKKLDSHTEMIGKLVVDMTTVKQTLHSHTEMIGSVMTDVSTIKANVEFLKGGLKKKVDYDEFLALERRLSVVEAQIHK